MDSSSIPSRRSPRNQAFIAIKWLVLTVVMVLVLAAPTLIFSYAH